MTPEEKAKHEEFLREINEVLNEDSKKFVDKARLYYAKNYFALRLYVGLQKETFVLTPYLAKMLRNIFSSQIANYEKEHGEIQTGQSIPSPFQNDLQKPDEGSQEKEGPNKNPPDIPKGKK